MVQTVSGLLLLPSGGLAHGLGSIVIAARRVLTY